MQDILNKGIVDKVRKENCFDFLRYLFAISLIVAHFCTLTGIEQFWFITGSMRVKAFFFITGFLVTYSFLRRNCDIISYTKKRFVRIVPAYLCCIVFCFVLGLIVTKLPLAEFLSTMQSYEYFIANIFMLNWLEPELPQTFQTNIRPQMDGSLWSMKLEVIFYILVPFIIYFIKRIDKNYVVLPVMFLSVLLYNFMPSHLQDFIYFFSGMFILLYFDIFCRYVKSFIVLAIWAEFFVYVVNVPYISSVFNSLEPISFGTLILGIAYESKPLNFLRKYDNVTYGLYLYHFPIIQLLILYGVKDCNITLCFMLSIFLTAILASFSWFLIEKPLINRFR